MCNLSAMALNCFLKVKYILFISNIINLLSSLRIKVWTGEFEIVHKYVGYVIYHCLLATLWCFDLLNFVILSFIMLLKYSRFKTCDYSSYFNCYFFRTTYLVCHTKLKCIHCIFQLIQPFEVLLVMMEVSKKHLLHLLMHFRDQ